MPELRNCPECGRLFSYTGRNLCHKCIESEEEEFKQVRKFVRDHPGATVFDTAEATGVDEEKILRFLREGRLISRGLQSGIVLKCERCGKVIDAGKYCKECLSELDHDFRRTIADSRPESKEGPKPGRDGDKMHIMDARDFRKPGK